jgi:hypothetical protein
MKREGEVVMDSMRKEIEAIDDARVNQYNFTELTASNQQKIEDIAIAAADRLDPRLREREEFRKLVSELKGKIADEMKVLERDKREKYERIQQAEAERRRVQIISNPPPPPRDPWWHWLPPAVVAVTALILI